MVPTSNIKNVGKFEIKPLHSQSNLCLHANLINHKHHILSIDYTRKRNKQRDKPQKKKKKKKGQNNVNQKTQKTKTKMNKNTPKQETKNNKNKTKQTKIKLNPNVIN